VLERDAFPLQFKTIVNAMRASSLVHRCSFAVWNAHEREYSFAHTPFHSCVASHSGGGGAVTTDFASTTFGRVGFTSPHAKDRAFRLLDVLTINHYHVRSCAESMTRAVAKLAWFRNLKPEFDGLALRHWPYWAVRGLVIGCADYRRGDFTESRDTSALRFAAALRARLQTALLPKPRLLSALTCRDNDDKVVVTCSAGSSNSMSSISGIGSNSSSTGSALSFIAQANRTTCAFDRASQDLCRWAGCCWDASDSAAEHLWCYAPKAVGVVQLANGLSVPTPCAAAARLELSKF
jgi:hypothetical protein